MSKKILIVGGTGFLGYHLAKFCLKRKWQVISVSRKKPKKIRFLKKVKYILFDISQKKLLKSKLKQHKNIDYVVNFGGEVEHKKLKQTLLSHFSGSKNLADFYLKSNIRKFIQIGSSLEYGDFKSPHRENLILKPKSNYSRAKSLASKNLLKLYVKHNFPVIIFRPYQVFGPNQDLNRLIPIVISNCLKDKKFSCSEGKQYRDFLYIDDFIQAISKSFSFQHSGEIFNIGYGKAYKIKEIIEHIRKKIKLGKPQYGLIKLRKEENILTYPCIKKLKKYLNWKPKIKIFNGINKTIKYYKRLSL